MRGGCRIHTPHLDLDNQVPQILPLPRQNQDDIHRGATRQVCCRS